MKTFKQGEDAILSVSVVESTAVDFSEATDVRVILFSGGEEQYKYALESDTDHGTVEVDGTNKNQLNIFVERAQSSEFAVGTLSATILAKFTNADFPSGSETRQWEVLAGRVTAGRGMDEEI